MALIEWNDTLSVGVTKFDNQHKNLIKIINDLNDAMRVGKGKDVMTNILNELINYTRFHFQSEEEAMEAANFPQLDDHKYEHGILTEQVMEFYREFNAGKKMITIQVMQFLKDWLNKHILGSDKLYTKYLNN